MTTIKWFTGLNTKEELKQQYRELAKQYHPDINKDVSDDSMKEINAEYDALYSLVLQGVDLTTYVFTETTEKEEQVALPNVVVIHLVRNRNYDVQVDDTENIYGRFFYYTTDRSYAFSYYGYRHVYSVKPDDPCKGIRTGFHACESIGDTDYFNDDITYVRVRKDVDMRPATLEEFIHVPMYRGSIDMYIRTCFAFDRGESFHNVIKIRRNSNSVLGHNIIYVESPIYGNFWAMEAKNDEFNAFFVVNGNVVHSLPFNPKVLNRKNLKITYYTTADVASLYATGYDYVGALDGADFDMPEICKYLQFKAKDCVNDWPLDAVLTRYVRMDVIRVYRHGKDMTGHFVEGNLLHAMMDKKIDLEDIDLIMTQFDQWYNACLESVKTGIKRDRIRLDI